MDISNLTNEDRIFIRTIYKEMRTNVETFCTDRDFKLSNAQLFTFLSFCSSALAIASDGVVDNKEVAMLDRISKTIDVNKMVNLELEELMSISPEPADVIINEEFNLRVGSEILYLSKNMTKYEESFIKAIKAMLTFDLSPKRENSLTNSFSKLMDSIIDNNTNKNKTEEMEKLNKIKERIGITQ